MASPSSIENYFLSEFKASVNPLKSNFVHHTNNTAAILRVFSFTSRVPLSTFTPNMAYKKIKRENPVYYRSLIQMQTIYRTFFPTDITLNKIPKTWNSVNTAYKAISDHKYFKTSLFSSFISDYKKKVKMQNGLLHLQSHYSVDRIYFFLVHQKMMWLNDNLKKISLLIYS